MHTRGSVSPHGWLDKIGHSYFAGLITVGNSFSCLLTFVMALTSLSACLFLETGFKCNFNSAETSVISEAHHVCLLTQA